jgi:hypothetical protein
MPAAPEMPARSYRREDWMAKRPSKQGVSTGVLVVLLTGVLVSQALQAGADHEPANKYSVAGSTLETIGAGTTAVILSERVKVSTTHDVVLQLNAECSILNNLMTQGSTQGNSIETDESFGQVVMWITIDGTHVPVSTADTSAASPGVQLDDGKVVFCNREYDRRVSDREGDDDGHDEESDFIRTRTANSFDWLALDVGVDCPDPQTSPETHCYDEAANGNNILDIEAHVEFTRTPAQCTNPAEPLGTSSCADAQVGRRTLVVEPTNASNHEQVVQHDPPPAP